MRVKSTEQNIHHEDASSALIKLEPDKRYRPLCHICGWPAATVHSQGHRRLLRDLNMARAQLWRQVEYRKIWCNNCGGTRVEQLSLADTGRRVTHRLARYVHARCRFMTIREVAGQGQHRWQEGIESQPICSFEE